MSQDWQRTALHQLAERVGIVERYHTLTGELRVTSEATAALLLHAMGFQVDSEAATERELVALDAVQYDRLLPPVCVVEQAALEHGAGYRLLVVRADNAGDEHASVLTLEDGETLTLTGRAQGARLELTLQGPLPLGYHTLTHATLRDGVPAHGAMRVIVAPTRCAEPPLRATGLAAQLYSARSAAELDQGVGDFGTLRDLCKLAGGCLLDFIQLSPLCALDLNAQDVSPYAPTTRLALHPLYLDVTRLLEPGDASFRTEAGGIDQTIDYADVLARKLAIAKAAHARGALTARLEADEGADRYALFAAIAEHVDARDFTSWPAELRDVRSTAVRALAQQLASRVAFHRAMQAVLSEQLRQAAQIAKHAGMRVGLITDLPVGSALGGADTWAQPQLFGRGVELGAPPDDYARDGQSWGLAPLVPFRSEEDGHRLLSALLRRAMRDAGGVRIDHVIGLVRQYWVPQGHSGRDGAYVRCPSQDWFSILALESVRNGCIVIGEDLGTVPEGLREELARRGILRSHVAFFERDHEGGFTSPLHYQACALSSLLTHDLPAFDELWAGRDLERKHALGVLDPTQLEQARIERAHARHKLLSALADARLLPEGWSTEPPSPEALARQDTDALHRALCAWLAQTPALLALSLDDLAGERQGVNIPGTDAKAGNWMRRMQRSVADLARDDALTRWLRQLAAGRRA